MKSAKLLAFVLAAVMGVSLVAPISAADDGIVKFNVTPVEEHADAAPETETVTAEPVVVKFGTALEMSAQGAGYYTHGDNITEGRYETPVGEIKLLYAERQQSGHPQYRCMPKFPNAKLTENHKYVRVTYKTSETFHSELILLNNGDRSYVTLAAEGSVSGGEWVRSDVADISDSGMLKRFLEGRHCTLGFLCAKEDAEFYIDEIAFFTTKRQAYEYYGDEFKSIAEDYFVMTFGEGGTATTTNGDTYGVHEYDKAARALKITYAEKTNLPVSYMAKIKFASSTKYTSDYRYIRVVYSAKNPDGMDGLSMYLRTDANANVACLVPELADTNGEFVMSEPAYVTQYTADRFAGTGEATSRTHNSLFVNTTREGGEYFVRAVYFFKTRSDAEAFELSASNRKITVEGGADISEYRIVIPDDAPVAAAFAAQLISDRIAELTGVRIETVTDREPESKYEIMIGTSDRVKTRDVLAAAQEKEYHYGRYVISIDDGDIVITAEKAPMLETAAYDFINNYLCGANPNPPETIVITQSELAAKTSDMHVSKYWSDFENVSEPVTVTEDFDSDSGIFTEENGASDWSIANGALSVDAVGDKLTYVHIYEPNATVSADVNVSSADKTGEVALMLRYTAEHAYVKAGYDFELSEWFIESREGEDFYLKRLASKKTSFDKGTNLRLTFTADGERLTLSVNGEKLIASDKATHVTPGRIAMFASDAKVSFDNVSMTLLSGEGTIIKNIDHTALYDDFSMAGGTVIELNDGTLKYFINRSISFTSTDGGVTWVDSGSFFDTMGQPNIVRLDDGSLLLIGKSGDSVDAYISTDECKTFTRIAKVCDAVYNGDTKLNASAVNMNDKIFVSPTTGRIHYSQNYEVFGSGTFDGKKVFCEFFYSDDNGKTWTKSETSAWEIEGHTDASYFGECKILECADGTLRMYNSWNHYGCIVYSESTDGGATWGPLVKMPEFVCSRSSMQFVRDSHADNDHTYYMVWVYSPYDPAVATMTRSRLSLAKSTDGKSWEYIGDLWRWESNYTGTGSHGLINHIVNPFIYVTKDSIIAGCGASERMHEDSAKQFHQQQRQHIWTVKKSTLSGGKTLNSFDDVKLGTDYYNSVSYVTMKGLFNGTSATTFEPDTTMNRAMFVTVLGRLDKADVSAYTTPTFIDVKAGEWYTAYVEWAAANGIVNGMGGGIYGVTGTVTVEQACTILYRYANGKTGDNTGKTLADYTDRAYVSAWAKDAVEWAVANGIYDGAADSLTPKAAASRALVAKMFANYVTKVK